MQHFLIQSQSVKSFIIVKKVYSIFIDKINTYKLLMIKINVHFRNYCNFKQELQVYCLGHYYQKSQLTNSLVMCDATELLAPQDKDAVLAELYPACRCLLTIEAGFHLNPCTHLATISCSYSCKLRHDIFRTLVKIVFETRYGSQEKAID